MREELLRLGEAARRASRRLMTASSGEKNAALEAIAAALEKNSARILAANAEDLANGRANGMPANLLDRMLLDEKRLAGIVTGVRQVAALKDPIGEVIHADTLPNGLIVSRSRVRRGGGGMISEARPNVSVDAAALTEVAETAGRLSLVVRYGDLRRFDAAPVIPLLQQLFLRACLTLEEACQCDAKAAPGVTAAMDHLDRLQLSHDCLEGDRWLELLSRV